MFTVTITYLNDGTPEKEKLKDIKRIEIQYDKVTVLTSDDIIYVYYYVTKVKCKLQMGS